ncbi:hypothetical protein FB45DRAFT_868119 [Roridomyces roridus]|uniref:Uncharacterized protein n=1 Tax=Roridomyces roridus TaxID=1738132 RepID=A0AAD7BPU8_9AGAR|nr:hypothetical protein FB45DRAFT_868119 [Roridomyces roridus]
MTGQGETDIPKKTHRYTPGVIPLPSATTEIADSLGVGRLDGGEMLGDLRTICAFSRTRGWMKARSRDMRRIESGAQSEWLQTTPAKITFFTSLGGYMASETQRVQLDLHCPYIWWGLGMRCPGEYKDAEDGERGWVENRDAGSKARRRGGEIHHGYIRQVREVLGLRIGAGRLQKGGIRAGSNGSENSGRQGNGPKKEGRPTPAIQLPLQLCTATGHRRAVLSRTWDVPGVGVGTSVSVRDSMPEPGSRATRKVADQPR